MKTLITFLVSTLFVLSGFAQYGQRQFGNSQTVTINFNGYGNSTNGYQVIMDGTAYSSRTNNNGTWNRNTSNRYGDDDITINNVQPGQHSIQVYRINTNNRSSGNDRGRGNDRRYGNTPSPVYSSTFNLRQGYDVILDIRSNGEVRFTEKRSNDGRRDNDRRDDDRRDRRGYDNDKRNGEYNNRGYRTPMADYQFSQIYQDVKGKWFQSGKVSAINEAFTNTASYFSTHQVMQLLQLISSESNRLGLAKTSYRMIADPANFTQVYSLFSSQSSREELDRFIRNYRYN